MSYDFTTDSVSAAHDALASEAMPWDSDVLAEAAVVAKAHAPRRTLTNIMYEGAESIFGVEGPAMLANGWSVYPQERDGARKPGRCYGETIRPINGHHLDVELPGADAMSTWSHQCATLNVACMLGAASGGVFAVDVDILDEAMTEEVVGMAYDILGPTEYRRTGKAPKAALLYRHAPDDVVSSTSRRFAECPENGLEILGHGKPLTFSGIHHTTGRYFTWSEAHPLRNRPELAPLVTSAMVSAFIAAVHARFPFTAGGHSSSGGGIVLDEGTGLVTHGREELLRKLVYRHVDAKREAILSAGAIPWLEDDIVQSVATAFAAEADLSGRWERHRVPAEVATRVRACVAKLQRGALPASRVAVEAAPAPAVEETTLPFLSLGHDRGRYFFMSRSGQIRDFSAKELVSTSTLIELAPMSYWRDKHPAGKVGVDSTGAADSLIERAHAIGIFDPDRIRGRGVYLDGAQSVVHLGDRLVIGAETLSPSAYHGRALYELSAPLPMVLGEPPMGIDEARGLIDVCEHLPLAKGQGRLLAGWLVIASVCGVLAWRPHAWITGEAGSGKSWALDSIVRPTLGDLAVYVQSKTTEAGLRGQLRLDARPVVFDEFEFQNATDRARGQQILDLARQASSEGGPDIVKGTQDGGSRRFRIRSCFLFSSINLGLDQSADISRTLVFQFQPSPNHAERNASFAALKAAHADTFDAGFGGRLLARTVSLLPVLRQNAETFAQAIARSGRTRRMGDTYGSPLAGLWALTSDAAATPAEADAFIAAQPFMDGETQVEDTAPEWRKCIDHMMQYAFDVESENGRKAEVRVGDALRHLAGGESTGFSDKAIAKALAHAGIKLEHSTTGEGYQVLVSSNSTDLGRDFERTTWGRAWYTTISRATGATKPSKAMRFGSLVSRGVSIPFMVFVGE